MAHRVTSAMLGRALFVLLVGLTAVLAPRHAAAQDVRALYRAAEQAVERGDYEAALEHFRAANELEPRIALVFNIAYTLEQLGRVVEALAAYEQVASDAELTPARRVAVREAIERVRARIATLVVEGEPSGAEVWVDGERRCALPCRTHRDPGSVEVEVRGEGSVASTRVTLEPGEEARVELRVRPPEIAPATSAEPEREQPGPRPTRGPGALTWIGIGVAVLGGAGLAGFGAAALDLHGRYQANDATPTEALRVEGELMRDLSNASIGIMALGAILTVIDLAFLAQEPIAADVTLGPTGVRVRF